MSRERRLKEAPRNPGLNVNLGEDVRQGGRAAFRLASMPIPLALRRQPVLHDPCVARRDISGARYLRLKALAGCRFACGGARRRDAERRTARARRTALGV